VNTRVNWPVRVGREDAGDLVFEALHKDPTIGEGMALTGLTANQWRNGLGYVKEVLAGAGATPVLYDPHTGRYSLAMSQDEPGDAVRAYQKMRLRVMRPQLQRLLVGTVRPAADALGTMSSRRLVHYLESAVGELTLLLDEVS
jgi:hypothetical protein